MKIQNKFFIKNKLIKFLSIPIALLFVVAIISFSKDNFSNVEKVHTAELSFAEHSNNSKLIGKVLPASCASMTWGSRGWNANGQYHLDGYYELVPNASCYNGVPRCDPGYKYNSSTFKCELIPIYCGADTGIYSGIPSYSLGYNDCYCNAGEIRKTRTVKTHVEGNACSAPVVTVASRSKERLDRLFSSLYPEKAYAGPSAPICFTSSYHFCASTAPEVKIKFQ